MRHLLAALVFLVLGSSAAFAQCSGDLAASQAGCTVIGIQKIPVSPQAPTNGQALTYNSAFNQWGPATGGGGGGGLSGMTAGQLPVAATSTTVTSSTPFGLTGNSTIVETTAGGLLTPSILPLATNAAIGGMKGDGTSISCVAGVCGSTSGFPITLGSTSVASGSTTTTIAGLTLSSPTINGGTMGASTAWTIASGTPTVYMGLDASNHLVTGTPPGSGNMTGSGSTTTGNFTLSNNTGATLNSAVDAGFGPPAIDDPFATGSISTKEWADTDTLIVTAASQTVTVPASSTLSRNGGNIILGLGGPTTLQATTPDVITSPTGTTGAAGSIPLPTGSINALTAAVSGTLKLLSSEIFTNTQAVTNTLTIATATFTPVLTAGINQQMTLIHGSCPCTIANPTGIASAVGQTGMFDIIESSSGSDTIGTWGSQYITPGGTSTLTLSTGASDVDHIAYRVIDSTHILLSPVMLNATH